LLDEAGAIRGSAVPNLSELRDNRPGHAYVPPLAREAAPADDRRSRFGQAQGPFAISEAIEALYTERERAELVSGRRRELLQGLRARRQKAARTLSKVEGDLERAGRAEEHLRRGELLKANLGRIKRGQREVTLVDYTEAGPVEVTLQLDQARTPRESLEREFHQYRRMLAGQTRARTRLEQLQAEVAGLDERIARAEQLDDEALLREPPARADEPAAQPRKGRAAGPALPYREHLSAAGQRIRVGRGARQNDSLTFRHSKGNDLWLHARGVGGAHVVVPLGRDEQVHEETLRDAAALAAYHSEARGDAVEVAWTRVKYVHKTKGAPGAVTYSQEKSLSVRPDPERISRLLSSQR
jgi:predicted ribosome quality control (RQC) complex YloA/Tae2 family protein